MLLVGGCASEVVIAGDSDESSGVDYCEADVAPDCIVRGDEGDACQSDDWCSYPLVCDDSAADFRAWVCAEE